jgi:hypothetical protein
MTRIYLESILRIVNPGSVPDDDEDLAYSTTDGSCDAGIDFLWRNDDGHVLIIQSKYRKPNTAESESEFCQLCDVLMRIHPDHGKKYKLKQRVRELAANIDWEKDSFHLQFVTLGRATPNMRAREKDGQHPISGVAEIENRVEITLVDETDLNQGLREAQSAAERVPASVELQFAFSKGQPPWLRIDGTDDQVAFVGYVTSGQLRNLFDRYKNKLFALNIRNYVGDTSTNKGMIETAQTDPDRFFFYNNGISAIATKVRPDASAGKLHLEQFSIVNGAQTVRSLARAHVKNAEKTAAASVLCRVTQVSLGKGADEQAFLDNVTKYNNTQNSVKVSDFRSNDPVQTGLAAKFKTLSRRGKQYWYKNKRTGESDPHRIAIGLEELARSIWSFEFGPIDVFGGTAHLFDTSADGGYLKLFGIDNQLPTVVSDEQFKYIAGRYFLCDAVRFTLAKVRTDAAKEHSGEDAALWTNALERRWMVYFTVGELMRAKYKKIGADLPGDLRRLAKPKWLDEPEDVKVVAEYVQAACEVLVKTYRSLIKKDEEDFKHRNWHRSKEVLEAIGFEIRNSKTMIAQLPLLASRGREADGV